MDYDDNDFQSHSLHLAGEESSKFCPVLKPYALPKFEFDETLQEHLRFDSLVETEVFLGIESNEDNQWIEDFSRGNSGIEFGSSAAESCSIARRNNVWSEATSSESVEMLLKSVGQEEIIPVQATLGESDMCDELGILAKQMEPSLKQDENISSKIEDATDLQPALLEDEIRGNVSEVNDDVGEEQPGVESSSQAYECETSIDKILSDQEPIDASANCGLPLTEDSLSADGKCENVNESNNNSLINEYQENKMPEHASTMEQQVDNVITSMHDTVKTYGDSRNQELGHMIDDTSDQKGSVLQEENGEARELLGPNKTEAESGICDMDGLPFMSKKVEFAEEQNAGNSSISDVEEHSELPIVEGCSNAECSEETMKGDKYENIILYGGKEVGNQLDITVKNVSQVASEGDIEDQVKVTALETSPVSCKSDGKLEELAIQFSSSNAARCVLEPEIDSLVQTHGHSSFDKDKEVLLVSGCEMHNQDTKFSKGESDGNSNFHVGGDSSTLPEACSSAELQQETPESDTLKCTSSTSGVCSERVNAEHHGSCSMLVESVQACEEEIMPMKVDAQNSYLDVGDHKLDNKEFISHSLVDKEVESSCSGVASIDSSEDALKICSDVTLENSNNVVSRKMDSAPAFTHLDKKDKEKEETANRRFTETSEIGLDSESGKKQILPETGDPPIAKRQDELQTVVNNEITQECSKELEAHSVLIASTEKEGDAIKTVLEQPEDANVKEKYEKATLKDSGEDEMLVQSEPLSLEKTFCDVDQKGSQEKEASIESEDKICEKISTFSTEGEGGSRHADEPGSPTVIRAVQHSQNEKKEVVKGTEKDDVPVSEIIEDARKFQPICQGSKQNDVSKSDTSFTFEVNSVANLSEREFGKSSQFSSTFSSAKESMVVEGSPSIHGFSPVKHKVMQDLSRGSQKVSDGETVHGSVKGTTVRKPRQTSPKGPGKDTSKQGNLAKEKTPRKSRKRDRASAVSLSPSGTGQLVQTVQVLTTSTTAAASLPDLNSSAPPPSVFHQPFTDLQQVQLRAQIFVYGSLIQGVAPDEAYMISAFGGADGGRSTWESAWQTALERQRSQKSPSVNPETPLPPRSGAKASDQAVRQSVIQSKDISTPAGRASSKGTPSNIVNPMIPLSSPLWNISTPCDPLQSIAMPRSPVMDYQPTFSPMHPYQTPPVRNFVAQNTWLSQPSFRGPWVASPQSSTIDTNACFPSLPSMEPVQLTPVKEQSGTHSLGIMHLSPAPMVHSGGPSVVFAGTAPQMDLKRATMSSGKQSADPKPRKRKKASNSEDPIQSQTEPLSVPALTHTSGSFSIATSVDLVPKSTAESVIMPVSPVSSTDHLKIGERDPALQANLSDVNVIKVKETKLHAEEAAALAASAVNHSQEIWSQLDKQKYSGSGSDIEAKLASAAVAIAAAASVAKAAAAVAKVAHDAALQAKFMADEALSSGGYRNPKTSNEFSFSDGKNISATSTHVSILNGDDGANSLTSIIVAAKEAARRRVEAASAASRRAENLDAIVKAAELAAEAVSQTGKIVCMGDPLPLKELVERGPAGYWKMPQVSSDLAAESKNVNDEQLNIDNAGEDLIVSTKNSEGPSADKETLSANHVKLTAPQEISTESKEHQVRCVDGIASSTTASEKKSRGPKGRKVSDMSKATGVGPESEIGSLSTTTSIDVHNIGENGSQSSRDTGIKEGSQVEVFKNDERFKAAWYPANVLSLQNGKAYVGYKELISDEGPVKEWLALEGEANEPPIIRLARPLTAVQFEGTRKRRRVAMGDYCWSVGNRVDALIQDSWREGVVTEKNKNDETSLTIHFPAQNETSVVRAWHLRPSLIWKDGEWVEWSSSVTKESTSHEGDTPQEKRLKMTTAAEEVKDKDEASKGNDTEPGKTEEPRLLNLSTDDTAFNIGKNTRDQNRPRTLRKAWTGLQKERSGVVFGVPKPGKKRKFMDVSKHFVGNQARKNDEPKDSTKASKYLMPQVSGTRSWRNNSKTDPKEKRVAESKPMAFKSGKPQSVSSRTLQKNGPAATSDTDTASDSLAQIRDSIGQVENASKKHKTTEFGSFPSNVEAAMTSDAKPEQASKGKLAPAVAGGRLPKIDEDKAPKIAEQPRRSVRRIQPTSRLLEGLQSSLIASKIPSISLDRSHKNKNPSRGIKTESRDVSCPNHGSSRELNQNRVQRGALLNVYNDDSGKK